MSHFFFLFVSFTNLFTVLFTSGARAVVSMDWLRRWNVLMADGLIFGWFGRIQSVVEVFDARMLFNTITNSQIYEIV